MSPKEFDGLGDVVRLAEPAQRNPLQVFARAEVTFDGLRGNPCPVA
ncbi:hypothetical protein LVY72_19695 [Arthrobacter sp. I2-34]|uniref:Uncharacterized protein n=1 Tax=Arthrobacter hankyongi TaxID=2904801 RepID=A0ABS9LBR1_9MICC|nr:hypothetical protein [Arthrobacter hankyongi]MCG2624115.1 hypothetical protein [Arthrobacter hankyongi]